MSDIVPTYLASLLNSVNLGNGTGQFSLDAMAQYKTTVNDDLIYLNMSTENAVADVLVSLDLLQATYPNLHHVHLPIAWFVNDVCCANLTVKPEYDSNVLTAPSVWQVHGQFYGQLAQISTDTNQGKIAYRGTPSDGSIVRLCIELNRRGITVTFVPILLVDVPVSNSLPNPYSNGASTLRQAAYPDRSQITVSPAVGYTGSVVGTTAVATQINAFFGTVAPYQIDITLASTGDVTTLYTGPSEWSYRRFVLHYTKLAMAINGVVADTVIGLVLGSRLTGITTAYDNTYSSPAVAALITLASDVKTVSTITDSTTGITTSLEVSYAASHTEWHGVNTGSLGGFLFHLDPLWANSNIDYIGLSWYQPLSDWRGTPNDLDRKVFGSVGTNYYQQNIEAAENYSWTYANLTARNSQVRTPISDPIYNQAWVYRSKDLRSWWTNYHYNRNLFGVVGTTPTAWTPYLKSFRFVEFGLPAIDKGTNQPDATSAALILASLNYTTLPYYSTGNTDSTMQMTALNAFITYWQTQNDYGGIHNNALIDMSIVSVFCWEARPWPWYPALTNMWLDDFNYATGYAINGKEGQDPTQQFTMLVDHSLLLTEAFSSNPLWTQLTDVLNQHTNPLLQDAINRLSLLRDPDASETYVKALNIQMMGFNVPIAGLSDAEYDRIVRHLGDFYQTQGASSQFVNFLAYVRNTRFVFVALALNGLDYDTLTPLAYLFNGVLVPNPNINMFFDNTGTDDNTRITSNTWLPSPYYQIYYDRVADPNLNEAVYTALFVALAPIHLVLTGFNGYQDTSTTLYNSAQLLDMNEITTYASSP